MLAPKVTLNFTSGAVAISYSVEIPPVTVIVVNPGPGVGTGAAECWTPEMIMSYGSVVDTVTEVPYPVPAREPGRDVLGSKGLLKLAPLIPKTWNKWSQLQQSL